MRGGDVCWQGTMMTETDGTNVNLNAGRDVCIAPFPDTHHQGRGLHTDPGEGT